MSAPFDALTQREKHILLLIAQGKTNLEIADAMGYARGSVRNYVSAILDKLGCSNRAQLAAYATLHKLEATRFWEPGPIAAPASDLDEQALEIYHRIARYSPRTAAAVIEALT